MNKPVADTIHLQSNKFAKVWFKITVHSVRLEVSNFFWLIPFLAQVPGPRPKMLQSYRAFLKWDLKKKHVE